MEQRENVAILSLGLFAGFSVGMFGMITYCVCYQGRTLNLNIDFGIFGRINMTVLSRRNYNQDINVDRRHM